MGGIVMKGIQWNLNEENYQFGKINIKGTSVNGKDAKNADEEQVKNGTIYAGNTNVTENNFVTTVKQSAQKRALKKLVDQMMDDLKNDDVITGYGEMKEQASEDMKTRQQQVQDLEVAKEQMMESYHMTEEDIDRTDAGLVMRSLTQPDKLSAEDKKRLAEIPDAQKGILICEAMQTIHQREMNNDQEIKKAAGKATEDFKVDLLKVHPMTDAQEEAEAIMEDARQTVLGMLKEEGINKIDKNIKENEEIQEKKEEEKKEEENRTEKNSTQTEQLGIEDSIKELQNVVKEHEKIQREVKNFMNKEILIDDDLKGINLDELL